MVDVTIDDLTESERLLWEASPQGTWVDLRAGKIAGHASGRRGFSCPGGGRDCAAHRPCKPFSRLSGCPSWRQGGCSPAAAPQAPALPDEVIYGSGRIDVSGRVGNPWAIFRGYLGGVAARPRTR
jgi:hypothetical protein